MQLNAKPIQTSQTPLLERLKAKLSRAKPFTSETTLFDVGYAQANKDILEFLIELEKQYDPPRHV